MLPKNESGPCIRIEGARQHNLKNVSVDIPRDKLVVVCGPSGSGKSTLAFDIVYAEGQRRYVESLSTYARMFLPKMDKPLVDKIEGLSLDKSQKLKTLKEIINLSSNKRERKYVKQKLRKLRGKMQS